MRPATPPVLLALVRHLAELLDPAEYGADDASTHFYRELGFDLAPEVVHDVFRCDDPARLYPGLGYHGHPFELFTFGWQGGDALQYGFVAHTQEPTGAGFPAACYAPGELVGGLADDAGDALALLVARACADRRGDPVVTTLVERLGLTPPYGQEWPAARPLREPDVPAGWRLEPAADGVGVLAEARFFGDVVVAPDEATDAALSRADALLAAAAPASALIVLKRARRNDVLRSREIAVLMGACYEALGRGHLVAQVDRYRDRHLHVSREGDRYAVFRGPRRVASSVDGQLVEVAAGEVVPAFEVNALVEVEARRHAS